MSGHDVTLRADGGRMGASPPPAPAAVADAATIRSRVLAYYNVATHDYLAWSRGFHMHFGYWRRGLNPFDREAMLEETSLQSLARLGLPSDRPARLADLGGGTGATARTAVARHPQLSVDVVTLVPLQASIGRALNAAAPRGDAITMHAADFAATPLASASCDAVCTIEAACHGSGATKQALLREAFRLLKPGGRFVMVDAMLLSAPPTHGLLGRLTAAIYRLWCRSWAVPEMCRRDLLPAALAAEGFVDASFEDWSWRIMPSVAHVPWIAGRFAVVEWVRARGRLPAWRKRHIVASLLTPLLGLRRSFVCYGAVVAIKPPVEA